MHDSVPINMARIVRNSLGWIEPGARDRSDGSPPYSQTSTNQIGNLRILRKQEIDQIHLALRYATDT